MTTKPNELTEAEIDIVSGGISAAVLTATIDDIELCPRIPVLIPIPRPGPGPDPGPILGPVAAGLTLAR
jgi:hypothetical protein